jgi:hypothetical protein
MHPILHPQNQCVSNNGINRIISAALPITKPDWLAKEMATAYNTPEGRRLIKILQTKIKQIVEPPAITTEQQAVAFITCNKWDKWDKSDKCDKLRTSKKNLYDTSVWLSENTLGFFWRERKIRPDVFLHNICERIFSSSHFFFSQKRI